MMGEPTEKWTLRDDLAAVLAREVSGWASRSVRLARSGDGGCAGFLFEDHPSDDRSEWRVDPSFFGVGEERQQVEDGAKWGTNTVCFDRRVVSTPGHMLSLVMVVLSSTDLGPRGSRWRLAARIIETAHPLVERGAADGDPEFVRLLPLFRWVRWRLLSEPFRVSGTSNTPYATGDRHPCGVGVSRGRGPDPFGPLAYAGGAFPGCRSLRRRARDSRTQWATTLLEYQDHPVLSRVDVEREGCLLVFGDAKRGKTGRGSREAQRSPLDFGDGDRSTGERPSVDQHFDSWFAREFFSRRFMVLDMWRTVRQRLKWTVLVFFLVSVFAGVSIAVWPAGRPNPFRWEWFADEPPVWLLALGATALALAMGFLIWGVTRPDGGERFAYPFLLRFAAGTVIGSAAIVAMRGVWIARFSNPSLTLPEDCPQSVQASPAWLGIALLLGLIVAGLAYLLLEVRIHGTSGRRVIRRAFAVWTIGLGWAFIIAAIDIVLISPTFTECFPVNLFGLGRFFAFAAIALASLDLGIFFQVLWEDRPVTYPLGALRFSRRT